MPDVTANVSKWDQTYPWTEQGDEWSRRWGGPKNQWWGSLYPRIHPLLPCGTILEIAPGYGRWTQFLQPRCERLIVVDLSENCIDHCKRRFADCSNIEYHHNDGKSLAMVPDGSVDLVFSFDSLVHADADAVRDYVLQLGRKLTPRGAGFIHHSNLESYIRPWKRVPRAIERRLNRRFHKATDRLWRSPEVSAETFAGYCREAGLSCIAQECITWSRKDYLTDCLSTFTPVGSIWDRPRELLKNWGFQAEADRLKRLTPAAKSPDA